MKKITILLFSAILLILPSFASAKIGVGVGSGKIQVDQTLKAGLIYTLPPITIINTGDEASDYGLGVQYRETQSEIKAPKEWFSFEPKTFHLEPGQTQVVQIKLTLPIKGALPGNYFVFLQGFPLNTAQAGNTSVGVAAAAKLYFTVAPANFFVGIYYRLISLYRQFAPWSYVLLAIILAATVVTVFRRFFSFNIGVNLKKK